MKNNFLCRFFYVALLLMANTVNIHCFSTTNADPVETRQVEYKMHKGINVSTWLCHNTTAKSGADAKGYFTQKELNQLAEMGFDHIRLPIDEKLLYKSGLIKDGDTFQMLHDIIGWCEEAGMTIALNFHIPRAGKSTVSMATSTAERTHIVNIWKDLSAEFGGYSNELVAYEIYNEPNFSSDDLWNQFATEMINAIRVNEPERIIILAPNGDNSIGKLPLLAMPTDKKNIIVSIHFYQPAILTHYGVGALAGINVKLQYPGNIFPAGAQDGFTTEQKNTLKAYSGNFTLESQKTRLEPLLNFAAYHKVRVRCGEYGCNDAYEKTFNDRDIKVRYFQDVVKAFDELNIPHCLWGYKATFGIFNDWGYLKDPRVLTAITGYEDKTSTDGVLFVQHAKGASFTNEITQALQEQAGGDITKVKKLMVSGELGAGEWATINTRFGGQITLETLDLSKAKVSTIYGGTSGSLIKDLKVREIVLPEGVTMIAANAFRELPELTEINIPPTMIIINEAAFFGCPKLSNISLTGSLMMIYKQAFSNTAISEIVLPAKLMNIGQSAFDCPQLTKVTFLGAAPNTVDAVSFGSYSGLVCVQEEHLASFAAAPWTSMDVQTCNVSSATPEVAASLMKIFPSVTSDIFYIIHAESNKQAFIYNMMGVLMQTIRLTGEEQQQVSVQSLPAGIYLCYVGEKTFRFVKR